ncbi:hypothetical protein SAMN04488125_102423 [Methylorubrum salsuginis]|uniref:Lipoprotein n=1 Tax=Methylorubrum salsuginis TaxID=414703 RepID=A0A1I4AL49_9HYPH|nr:hypothetical protein SAMN04488125_102423 [Methylorubrum salsuginis]
MVPGTGPLSSGVPLVLRKLLVPGVTAAFLGGCASTPLVPFNAEQTKTRDQEIRLGFAKLVARSNALGVDNWLVGKRYYNTAQISVPPREAGINPVCVKVTVANDVTGVRNRGISGEVVEGPNGMSVTLNKYTDDSDQRCKAPYTPFPELEALSPK